MMSKVVKELKGSNKKNWSSWDSNPRPFAVFKPGIQIPSLCKADALPTAPQPRFESLLVRPKIII